MAPEEMYWLNGGLESLATSDFSSVRYGWRYIVGGMC